jgi:hypothetical protein
VLPYGQQEVLRLMEKGKVQVKLCSTLLCTDTQHSVLLWTGDSRKCSVFL